MQVPENKTTTSGGSAAFGHLFRFHARRVFSGLLYAFLFALLLFIFLPGQQPFRAAYTPRPQETEDSSHRHRFRTAADSLRGTVHFQQQLLRNTGPGWRMLRIGLVTLQPIPMPGAPLGYLAEKGGRFLRVEGFRICDSCHFSLDGRGGYQVEYPVEQQAADGINWTAYERQPVPVRFTLTDARRNQGTLMIPVTQDEGLVQWTLSILVAATAVYLLFALFIRPLRMLYRVAEGDFFEPGHGRTLQGIALGMVVIGLVPVVLTEFSEHLYAAVIPPHFHYPAWEAVLEQRAWIGAGVIFFILSRAFKRGYGKDSIV